MRRYLEFISIFLYFLDMSLALNVGTRSSMGLSIGRRAMHRMRVAHLSSSSSSSSAPKSDSTIHSDVRVATYNVLSSHLAEPNYFTRCDPAHLDASYRLQSILRKFDSEVEKYAIICLQEVSLSWLGPMHAYFGRKGYQFITASYGNRFNNYMGVAIAVPLNKYRVVEADVCRLSDKIPQQVPREERNTKGGRRPLRDGFGLFPRIRYLYKRLTGCGDDGHGINDKDKDNGNGNGNGNGDGAMLPSKDSEEGKILQYWRKAEARKNQMICLRLESLVAGSDNGSTNTSTSIRSNGAAHTFCVGTYHMPCAFYMPPMMMLHCALSANHLRQFSRGDPFVYAGDFNIKPGSPMYRLLTDGAIGATESAAPAPVPGVEEEEGHDWYTAIQPPLRSAYFVQDGAEPDYTNYAQVRDDAPFIDCLDYIFLSPEWAVTDVLPLAHRDNTQGPLPSRGEPSDHVMIASTLNLRRGNNKNRT